MSRLEWLSGCFCESAIERLEEIFKIANDTDDENTKKELQSELHAVLREGMRVGVVRHKASPSGNQHIVVMDNLCFIVNIYGANVLIDDWLFFDGELDVLNFHWVEEDHLVVFDVCYIVRDLWQKCICHFAPSDFFVYFTPITGGESEF